MEDRIQINGIWYVRENNDTDNSLEDYMQNNVVTYQCMAFENFEWAFQAHADLGPVPILDLIQIENKVTGKIAVWDNLKFIKNFDPSSYRYEDDDVMNGSTEGLKLMKYFINEVKKKGWLE